MFENTLLILKTDYKHKRKNVLLMLLEQGFLIQGSRKLRFTPEQAAVFSKDLMSEKDYMLQVIHLSKGPAEAFILTKQEAIAELVNVMICYFTTSIEMDRNVHISKTAQQAQYQIKYIFPNYLHEPIPFFDEAEFCSIPAIADIISEVYDMHSKNMGHDPHWKRMFADWLAKSNKALPIIYKESTRTHPRLVDAGQQVSFLSSVRRGKPRGPMPDTQERFSSEKTTSLSMSIDSDVQRTSSSCVSCPDFFTEHPCDKKDLADLIKEKTEPLQKPADEEAPSCAEAFWDDITAHAYLSEPDFVEEEEGLNNAQLEEEVAVVEMVVPDDGTPADCLPLKPLAEIPIEHLVEESDMDTVPVAPPPIPTEAVEPVPAQPSPAEETPAEPPVAEPPVAEPPVVEPPVAAPPAASETAAPEGPVADDNPAAAEAPAEPADAPNE